LVGKPEEKRALGRTRSILEDNITIDIRNLVWEVVGWMHPAQDTDERRAFVKTVMNLRVS
jgi:hypothetical protein